MELGARESGFARTNADMVAWHRGMAVLQRRIADETPVGSVQVPPPPLGISSVLKDT